MIQRFVVFLLKSYFFIYPVTVIVGVEMAVWVPYLLFYGLVEPHMQPRRRVIEYFNIWMLNCLFLCYLSFQMTQDNYEVQYELGFVAATLYVLTIFFNVIYIVYDPLEICYAIYRLKQIDREKEKKARKERELKEKEEAEARAKALQEAEAQARASMEAEEQQKRAR